MGNSQKAQEEVKVEIAQNLGQFLTDIQVQDTNVQIPINTPIPPTPCFKEENKIQVIPQQILEKMYEQEDKLKEQRKFELQLKKEEKQIQTAKASYERRKNQNIQRFKQIQKRKETCQQIYQDEYHSVNNDKKQNQQKSHDDTQTQLIWGKKVSIKIVDPMDQYFQYRYPKDETLDQSEQYKNWHIYKLKMFKDEMNQLNSKEEKLKNLQADLKEKYFTLLERKQQRLNTSVTYAQLKSKQAKQKSFVSTPSPKKKKRREKGSEQQNSSTLSPQKISKNRSQQTTDNNITQSFNKQPQDTMESPSFINDFLSVMEDKNSQHWSPKQPQVDFLTKQIFLYQNYAMKRRSSFVYSREEVEKIIMEENQYPSKRKNYERPSRNADNFQRNINFRSKSKSPKKKKKVKQVLQELPPLQTKLESALETSVYHKVYEKLPKKQIKMMYSQSQGKLKQVDNFYPFQGSESQVKQNIEFPATMKVNDSVKNSPSKQMTQYRIEPKLKPSPKKLGQLVKRQKTLQSLEENLQLCDEQKEIWKKKRSQRDYEAKILERVRRKHLA